MRTEVRVGRPFDIERAVATALHGASLRVGDHEVEVEGEWPEAVVMEKASKADQRLTLDLELSPDAIAGLRAARCALDEVQLVVLQTLPLTKTSTIAWQQPVASLTPGRISFDLLKVGSQAFVSAVAGGARASLSAYLVTTSDDSMAPFPPGTWLSRAKYTFGGGGRGFQFAVYPLDDEQYEAGVHRKAASYLTIGQSVATTSADELDVTVYVNKELLGQLGVMDSPAALALTRRLELDVIFGMLARLAKDCTDQEIDSWLTLQQFEGSAGVRLLSNLGDSLKGAMPNIEDGPEKAFQLLIGGELALLRSALEAELGVLEADRRAMSPAATRGGS